MSSDAELISDELFKASQEFDLGLRIKNNGLWIRCPYHGGGRERTPSMQVTVDYANRYFAKAKCHGCGARVHYNELATQFNLQKIDKNFKAVGNRQLSFREKLKNRTQKREKEIVHQEFKRSTFEWPIDRDWRTIPGKYVIAEGAELAETRDALDEPRLIFPVTLYGEIKGYIYAMISDPRRDADGRKIDTPYINSSGPWKEKIVVGFDQARKELKKHPNKPLWIVEGPRDRLHMIAAGCIVIANIGSSFSKEKAELIKLLNPKRLLVASDADEAGEKLADSILEHLNGAIKMTKINWPKGKDPCNINRERLAQINKRYTIVHLKKNYIHVSKSNKVSRKRPRVSNAYTFAVKKIPLDRKLRSARSN